MAMSEEGACSQNSERANMDCVHMIEVCIQKGEGVWFGAAARDNQVVATDFSLKKPDVERLRRKLSHGAQFHVLEEPNEFLAEVLDIIEEIFSGKDNGHYGIKIDVSHLSGYTQKVLHCTGKVPVGYVTTYGALAKAAGGIARSVGQVQALNPVPLLIPCHRVVRSDLSIGGYGYGTETKMEILRREDRGYEEPLELMVNDKRLAMFPVRRVKQKSM